MDAITTTPNTNPEKYDNDLPTITQESYERIAGSFDEDIRMAVMRFAWDLSTEYGCKTASEKALVELIIGAYGRVLSHSKVTNQAAKRHWEFDNPEINYYGMISKELDRANRQLIAALTTLRQMKAPQIEVRIKAETAFIGQNQQFNSNSDPRTPHNYGINKPK